MGGVLLHIRIAEYFRDKTHVERGVSVLNSHFDALRLELWPRLHWLLDQNLQSLGTLARVERETAEQKESEQQQALNSGGTPSAAPTAAATGASGSGPAG